MDRETTDQPAEQRTAPIPDAEWALVEIMGHRRHYGCITEVSRFGAVMLQVDVPTEVPGAFNRVYYGAASIFAVTLCTEKAARTGAETMRPRPYVPYQPLALTSDDEDEIGAANELVAEEESERRHRGNDPNQDNLEF